MCCVLYLPSPWVKNNPNLVDFNPVFFRVYTYYVLEVDWNVCFLTLYCSHTAGTSGGICQMKSHASVTAEGHESRSSPVTNLQISTSPAAFSLNLAGTKHTILASPAVVGWRGTSRCGRVGTLSCSNLLLSWWLLRFPSLAAACEVRHDNQLNSKENKPK